MSLSDEGQIAVVGIPPGRLPRAGDGCGVRRDVDIEILEPKEILAGGVGHRAHPIDADSGDVPQTGGATMRHAFPHGFMAAAAPWPPCSACMARRGGVGSVLRPCPCPFGSLAAMRQN